MTKSSRVISYSKNDDYCKHQVNIRKVKTHISKKNYSRQLLKTKKLQTSNSKIAVIHLFSKLDT